MTAYEYKYKELKAWLEENSDQAFCVEVIEELEALIERVAE